jgi:hypothetical protein
LPAGSVGGFPLDAAEIPARLPESEVGSSARQSFVNGDDRPGPAEDRAFVYPAGVAGVDPLQDPVEFINSLPSGWVREMGIRILEASADRVTCEWEVSEKHHQGYGIVHGGVHAGVVETLASLGAALPPARGEWWASRTAPPSSAPCARAGCTPRPGP